MSRVKGPSDAPSAPAGSGPATEAARPEDAAWASGPEAAGAAASTPAMAAAAGALQPIYERVAARLASGQLKGQAQAIRQVVADVLAESMASLPPGTRDTLSAQIAEVLLDDPALSARLDRLLGKG